VATGLPQHNSNCDSHWTGFTLL